MSEPYDRKAVVTASVRRQTMREMERPIMVRNKAGWLVAHPTRKRKPRPSSGGKGVGDE